jgi:transcription initiation factor TFIIIB Brf1 subunit/transcription initiation factor TFIIB
MCESGTILTPEGLIVCRDAGEVIGVEMEHSVPYGEAYADRPSWHVLPSLKPNLAAPRGMRKPIDWVKLYFLKSEKKLVELLQRLHELASKFQVPQIVVDDAAVVLRKVLSTHASRPTSYDCLVYVSLLVALNVRGVRVPEELWREAWKAKCKVLSWATRLQHLLHRSDLPRLRDRVAAMVEEKCRKLGVDGDLASLAKKLAFEAWDAKVRNGVSRIGLKAIVDTVVYAVLLVHGETEKARKLKLRSADMRARRLIKSMLVIEVEA